MPNWRQNLLSAGESLSLTRDKKKKETIAPNYNSSSLSRLNTLSTAIITTDTLTDPVKTNITNGSVNNTNSSNGRSRKSSQCVDSATETVCSFQYESKKGYAFHESDVSVDFSSFLTDSSSFADYEDRRGSVTNLKDALEDLPFDCCRSQLKIDRVPFTNSVYYVSTKSEYEAGVGLPQTDIYFVDTALQNDKSDSLSTSTCDSFERCQFDCREFEPFSDTCCCDPNSEGGCTRSPKLLDSPEFCTSPVRNQYFDHDEDRLSNRSDMDGLDLTLFEPAVNYDQDDFNKSCCDSPGKDGNVTEGTLLMLLTEPLNNDEIGAAADWQPHFCVLLQDRGVLAAYRSEDMAMGSSLPRVRVDNPCNGGNGISRGALRCWAAPSIAEEPSVVPEDDTTSLQDLSILGELKCLSLPYGVKPPGSLKGSKLCVETLPSPPAGPKCPLTLEIPPPLDLVKEGDTSYEKACRRGSGGPPSTNGTPVASSPSRLAAFFFSKRSLRASPLKRARSAAKLAPRTPLRSSRSHESLLSQPAACVATVVGGAARPLHASLAGGRAHCFLLHLPGPPPSTRYFACASRLERDTWINNLRASLQPEGGNSIRRTERTLRLYLLEAKGLPPKKRYYCELLLDATLYARTSSKLKTDLCFWGEVFEFSGLPHINVITVDVYREPDRKPRKRDKRFLVGSVKIPIHELLGRHQSERWHPILNANNMANGDANGDSPPPSLRVKCRYQTLEVLPIQQYDPLLNYLRDNYTKLLEYLEPIIGVKGKEEVAGALVGTVRGAGGAAAAARLLAAAAALEVRRAPHAALAFRANSLATKATEAYMKMLGETYLQETLWECVSGAMGGGTGGVWEVDPTKGVGNGAALRRQRARLRSAVSRTWKAVMDSAPRFPPDLRLTFAAFREKLRSMQREELADHIVSASVFLRFLCPAILSPSLFGITHEYPDERAARNLTLVAKTLQTLANFTRFQGKEVFMEFLNDFLEEEAPNMRLFLKEISTLPPGTESALNEEWGSGPAAGHLDLGKQLAALHLLLAESVPRLNPAALQELDPLPSILEQLSELLQEPNVPQNDTTTHSEMHDNIFKYNDPTYSPCSGDSTATHSSPLLTRNVLQVNTISSTNSSQQEDSMPTSKYNTSLLSHLGIRKSPSLGIRAATLPRNNYNNLQANPDRYSSQYNNREHCVNLKVVQIGLDSKNASSPSLMRKMNSSNGNIHAHSLQRNDQTNRQLGSETYLPGSKSLYLDNINKNDDRLVNNYDSNSSPRIHTYRTQMENAQSNIRTNLEELSDLLKYVDDQETIDNHDVINQRMSNHEIVPQTNINIMTNGNQLVNHNHMHNGGSNVSISGLSNVASSGYQSFATYSQSSSPVELYQQTNANFSEGSPAHLVRRPGLLDKKNNLNKIPQHQRFEYERQKFGIQNFTTDNGSKSPRLITTTPLTFTNPVYHVEENQAEERLSNIIHEDANTNRQLPKRSVSTTSSSSIEDDTTDNVETNSEDNDRNYRDRNAKHRRNTRDVGKQQKPNDVRHTKSTAEPQPLRRLVNKSKSNGSDCIGITSATNNVDSNRSHKPLEYTDPVAPARRTINSRQPRTNPNMTTYNTNQNVIHFGQTNNDILYNNNDATNGRYSGNSTRPDSNVEETNKEMYRLQISRSQKAIYDRNNVESFSNSNIPRVLDKYDNNNTKNNNGEIYTTAGMNEALDAIKNNYAKNEFENDHGPLVITENGYPIERNYSKTNISSTRLNEDLNFDNRENIERSRKLLERERDGLERVVRRLSLEGVGDSSSDQEDSCYHTTGRRRLNKNHRTIHQYEREIERLKCSLDMLKQKLKAGDAVDLPPTTDLQDSKMKGIITRLLVVEEELRREQRDMAAALNKKQKVIERQGQRLAALGAANARLRSALHHLKPDLSPNVIDGNEYNPEDDLKLYTDKTSINIQNNRNSDPNYNAEQHLESNQMNNNFASRQGYGVEKSPSHQQLDSYYQDKNLHNDNQSIYVVRNSDKSPPNQQLKVYKSDKSPTHHQMDAHHQMYHDKGIINLQNDEDKYMYGDGKVNRNSDPVNHRQCSPMDYHRQNDLMSQFNQSERSLVPSDNHQAVITTQPAIYYSNNS